MKLFSSSDRNARFKLLTQIEHFVEHLSSKIGKYSLPFTDLTQIGMRQGGFTPLIIFGLDFVSWIFIKNFQTFLEVKIEINRDNLTPCQAHWVLLNFLLGCPKDEHFSYFHSSCQLGLIPPPPNTHLWSVSHPRAFGNEGQGPEGARGQSTPNFGTSKRFSFKRPFYLVLIIYPSRF